MKSLKEKIKNVFGIFQKGLSLKIFSIISHKTLYTETSKE
jgi:hypothetical protein